MFDFGKFMDRVAPAFMMKREVAAHRLELLRKIYAGEKRRERTFDAVSGDRLEYDFLSPHNDADSAIRDKAEKLRNHVREQETNDGNIKGPLKRLANHIVGTGLKFQSRVVSDKKYLRIPEGFRITPEIAERFNFNRERLFKIWCRQADQHLTQKFHEMQWLVQLTLLRDGEVLVIGRNSKRKDRLIPYCQQIVEIDRLATPSEFNTDPQVRNGIRYDSEGVPSTYYVSKEHPGNMSHLPLLNVNDYEEVPAFNENGTRKVIHLFRIMRPEQTRGFAEIAAGLGDVQSAGRYKKAEMFAALEDACMTGIVKTNNPSAFVSNYTESGDDPDKKIHEFSPGKWHYLNPGEDAYIRDPKRPNDHFDEIVKSFFRSPANALDMPLELFLQDLHDINYSNARTIILLFMVSCRIHQKYLRDHYLGDTEENVLHQFVAKGLLQAPAFLERKYDYLESNWIPPKLEWIDPEKEAKGKQAEVSLYTETPSSLCAMKGTDFEENAEVMAKNLKKIKELEEEYDVKMPSPFEKKGDFQAQDGKEDEGPEKKPAKVLKIK